MATPLAKYWLATAMYLNWLSLRFTCSPPRLLPMLFASSYWRRGVPRLSRQPVMATR